MNFIYSCRASKDAYFSLKNFYLKVLAKSEKMQDSTAHYTCFDTLTKISSWPLSLISTETIFSHIFH